MDTKLKTKPENSLNDSVVYIYKCKNGLRQYILFSKIHTHYI